MGSSHREDMGNDRAAGSEWDLLEVHEGDNAMHGHGGLIIHACRVQGGRGLLELFESDDAIVVGIHLR